MRELLSKFEEVEVLIRIGEFQHGADPLADRAVERRNTINAFLRQSLHHRLPWDATLDALNGVLA